ncbi:GNAT family N-acetyltransferase [Salirhabdus sp. Marseille-P4669]|uniref:GNAT family N-acetyltransferase n=1 Tax=Salirhabdus sp. Marseille-P4669 TaxID=2042310 RepID=UPI000C7A0644|nr:GNAT family N-acetyltransferase [Salirhabdus sp. Marseille-P4669]
MDLYSKDMTITEAKEILNWKYPKPYDFYNNALSVDAMDELLNGDYQAIFNRNDLLVGFFCVGKSAQVPAGSKIGVYKGNYIDMGLGMHPYLTGKGNGNTFCTYILNNIQEHYKTKSVRLTVATFNTRAIHLYKNLGFIKHQEFSNGSTNFITMIHSE